MAGIAEKNGLRLDLLPVPWYIIENGGRIAKGGGAWIPILSAREVRAK